MFLLYRRFPEKVNLLTQHSSDQHPSTPNLHFFSRAEKIQLRFMERCARVAGRQPAVAKLPHELLCLAAVGNFPKRRQHLPGAGDFESALQAVHPFAAFGFAQPAFTGTQDSKAGVLQIQVADFRVGRDTPPFSPNQNRI